MIYVDGASKGFVLGQGYNVGGSRAKTIILIVKNPIPFTGLACSHKPCLTSLSENSVQQVKIPSNACSSLKLYRLRLKVPMGRDGVVDMTSLLNIGEEHYTPKGGKRFVRLRFKLS